MKGTVGAVLLCATLIACNSAKDTSLPHELDKMESNKLAMERLTPEQRELLAGYLMRHTPDAATRKVFGGPATPPKGMTMGKAIEEQRQFLSQRRAEERRQADLRAALHAKPDAALRSMREAVTVTLVFKESETEYGVNGMLVGETSFVTVGYKNNTVREISGVKGLVSVRDRLGEELASFTASVDTTILAGQSITSTGSRSIEYAPGVNKDRNPAEFDDTNKYDIVWFPEVIVFTDGMKLEVLDSDG